jgi:hypothetical protein
VIGTALPCLLALVLRARGREHDPAPTFRHLHEDLPDASRGCMHETRRARGNVGNVVHQVVRRAALEHGRGSHVEADRVGNACRQKRRHSRVLGVASPCDAPGDAIAGGEAIDLGAASDDGARTFHPEGAGKADRVGLRARILALPCVHVHEVHTGTHHSHEYVLGSELRQRNVAAMFQDLRPTVTRDGNRAHDHRQESACHAGGPRS